MRARMLFVAVMTISTLIVVASPASAKVSIAEAEITGPGIDGSIRIGRRHTLRLWEYGIGPMGGGLAEARPESVEALGLNSSDLGARYLVTYRFAPGYRDDPIRQDLYPYAEGGPVTYTPGRQRLTGLFGKGGLLEVIPGWHESSSASFLPYLESRGLPAFNPVGQGAIGDVAPGIPRAVHTGAWTSVVVVLVGVIALWLATVAMRRRVLAADRANR